MVAQERRPKILVVDDELDNVELMVRALRANFEVLTASSGKEALEVLGKNDVAVIVTDQRMPGMTGVQFLREASQARPGAKRLLLTAYADADSLIQAINEGRVHYYIRKPWERHQLQATVSELVTLRRLEDENRRILEELSHANRELAEREKLLAHDLDERGRELLAANTQLRAANDHLAKLAYRDGLTGLYNHRSFQERLREEVARSVRYRQPCSMVFMDIDQFKKFNDLHGHPAGDEVLKAIGRLLLGQLDAEVNARESDVAARYGGEELVMILPETPRDGASIKAERLRSATERLTFGGLEGVVTMSFGVAECPADASTADELILCADQALYRAKHTGRNRVVTYGEWAKNGDPTPAAAAAEAALPSFAQCAGQAEAILSRTGHLVVLYVDLSDLGRVEREYGSSEYRELIDRIGPAVARISPDTIRVGDVVALGYQEQASLVVFLAGPRAGGEPPDAEAMNALCDRVTRYVQDIVEAEMGSLTRMPARVSVGYAVGLDTRRLERERLVASLVREAATGAHANRARMQQSEKTAIQSLILGRRLRSVFQPILGSSDGRVIGYEALVRGPEGTPVEQASPLLQAALRADLEVEFDDACVRSALMGAAGLKSDMLLFLNLLPPTFHDRPYVTETLPKLLGEAGLSPERVVLEVTEQLAITNLDRFKKALEPVRALGFRIALDDVGAAQANLRHVQTLAPDYLKLDISIVNGIAGVSPRCEMVRSLVHVGEGFGARCIAEGVEAEADFHALRVAGVQYVQGFYFARPGPPFPEPRPLPQAPPGPTPVDSGGAPR